MWAQLDPAIQCCHCIQLCMYSTWFGNIHELIKACMDLIRPSQGKMCLHHSVLFSNSSLKLFSWGKNKRKCNSCYFCSGREGERCWPTYCSSFSFAFHSLICKRRTGQDSSWSPVPDWADTNIPLMVSVCVYDVPSLSNRLQIVNQVHFSPLVTLLPWIKRVEKWNLSCKEWMIWYCTEDAFSEDFVEVFDYLAFIAKVFTRAMLI